ncbi:hypothetical protein FHT00_001542 [Sphingomonas insulae]|uniref:Uncharacterized protein n=1 Tax=Sphingomonas insulae TaxID=424800 RepID=A0ABN1HYD3_9SPHN|nr:hypothetical protein [Sphingomonas insulae]NIJ29595.1 hypothetical protein [Sphingomonas insulae]
MIARALAASAARHGVAIALRHVAERPWSSATFTGARLTLALDLDGGDPAGWLAALPEEDLPVPGHLVADLVVVAASADRATLEVLLLDG